MSSTEIGTVISTLTGQTRDVDAATAPPTSGGIPTTKGLYAWWVRRGALNLTSARGHPTEADIDLLYVGVAPVRPSSTQTLRSRVVSNHLRGNIGASTFRFSLAALLLAELDLTPSKRRTKVVLPPSDNERLSGWQTTNLRLSWADVTDPWLVEGEIIDRLAAPMNLQGNGSHPFHVAMTAARAALRAQATAG